MPEQIPRACRKVGCGGKTTDKSGYCPAHINEGWTQHQKGRSRHQRGYGSAWEKIREQRLRLDKYLCQICKSNGVIRPAVVVDHIKPKEHGGTDDIENLQSLCIPCNGTKTAMDRLRR